MTEYKLGKKPATHDRRDLQLAHFATAAALVPAPVGFGVYTKFARDGWGMLGNDMYGDCEWAEADHCVMGLNALVGKTVPFVPSNTLMDYSDCTGFKANDASTDQGTDMHQSMAYRRKIGVVDANGRRHKIGAYLTLEPGNWLQLLEALWAFQVVSIGFAFPDYAMAQFNAGRAWSVHSGAPVPTEGHAVCVVGRPKVSSVYVVTWGQIQEMTKGFYTKYCDEAYAFISQEDLVKGISPAGYNLTQLNSILGAL